MTARGRHSRAGHDRPLHEARGPVGAGHAPPADRAGGAPTKAALEKRVDELERQLEELEKRIATTEAERDEYLADLQRLAADFENYRKRAARDQESLVARAHERLVKELLPVLDDLERALEAAAVGDPVQGRGGGETSSQATKLEEGVRLVERQLRETLRREGLVEIETNGRFDPHVHEALLSQPAEQEEGAVIEVLQRGYRLGDRVLRPARVVISQGTPTRGSTPSSTPQEGDRDGDAH